MGRPRIMIKIEERIQTTLTFCVKCHLKAINYLESKFYLTNRTRLRIATIIKSIMFSLYKTRKLTNGRVGGSILRPQYFEFA